MLPAPHVLFFTDQENPTKWLYLSEEGAGAGVFPIQVSLGLHLVQVGGSPLAQSLFSFLLTKLPERTCEFLCL